MLRHTVQFLAQTAPKAPDLGWLTEMASKLLLVIQLAITAVIAVRIAGDAGGAAVGGSSARASAKLAIIERLGWLGFVWVIGLVVTIALWVVGH